MSTELPAGFLCLPAAGDRTLPALRRKLGLLCLHTLLTLHPARAGRLQGRFARFQRWLEVVARGPHKKALTRALASLDVVTPTLVLRSGLGEAEQLLAELVPALLVALEHANGGTFTERLLWDVPVRHLLDARGGRALELDPPGRGALADRSGLEIRTATGLAFSPTRAATDSLPTGARAVQAFFPLGDSPLPALALADSNPLRMLEEHPEKLGNALSLGERSPEAWADALRDALELIRLALPELHREMIDTLERVVPVGYEPERHLSASYREAPGLVYVTLHPSPLTMAEALVHETQHGKLNAASWFDSVLENGQSAWTPSPVRPDLRPLWGVLLAVHAFVPVSALHLRLAELDHPLTRTDAFAQRRAEVLAANRDGLGTLERLARPTELGRRVVGAIAVLADAVSLAAPKLQSDATVTALG